MWQTDPGASPLQRTVSLSILCGLGAGLGLLVAHQSVLAALVWGLAGGVAAAPVLMAAARVVRHVERRRSPLLTAVDDAQQPHHE